MAMIESRTFEIGNIRVEIRTALPGDAKRTLSLYKSVIKEGRYTLMQLDEVKRGVEQEGEAIKKELENPGDLRIVAEVKDKIVGMARIRAGVVKRTSHFGEIDSVWVDKVWRGRGIGGMLIDTLIRWAEENDQIEKLGLFVFSSSVAAVRLYENRGFMIEGRAPNDIKFGPDDYADTIIMGRSTR
jgi:ribosomal protein S18 acetylase RimI-like enzyme